MLEFNQHNKLYGIRKSDEYTVCIKRVAKKYYECEYSGNIICPKHTYYDIEWRKFGFCRHIRLHHSIPDDIVMDFLFNPRIRNKKEKREFFDTKIPKKLGFFD